MLVAERCLHATRNINLTDELDRFVVEKVESGKYANASEVMRAALRSLERNEQAFEQKMAMLQQTLEVGAASGIADPGAFERIRQKYDLPQREA